MPRVEININLFRRISRAYALLNPNCTQVELTGFPQPASLTRGKFSWDKAFHHTGTTQRIGKLKRVVVRGLLVREYEVPVYLGSVPIEQ